MKKLFLAVLAVAALAACKKDALVQQQEGTAITFANAFVDNATRAAVDPSTTTDNITEMNVWGFMDQPRGVIFLGQKVTRNDKDSPWTYSPLQYWFPGHDYYFAAVSPYDGENVKVTPTYTEDAYNGIGKITFTNVDGSTDLIYSATTVSTKDLKVGEAVEPVKFTFNHLLSKVKFTFTNAFPQWITWMEVTDIRMEATAKGEINLAQEDWWSTNKWGNYSGTTILSYGDVLGGNVIPGGRTAESDKECLLIPREKGSYKIYFNVALYVGDGTVLAHSASLMTKAPGVTLEMGKAYNFHCTIDHTNITGEGALKPIEFEVTEVKDWVDGEGYDGGTVPTFVQK